MVFISSSFLILATVLTALLANARPSSEKLQRRRAGSGPIDGWTFVGCFTDDNPATRTLHEATTANSQTMTPAVCTTFCQGDAESPAGFAFAGTEFTSECYCDFDIQGTSAQVDDSECNMPCAGDDSLTCGGGGRLSVYTNGSPVPTNKNVGDWTFEGCHTDVVDGNGRTLTERFDIPDGVTIESCIEQCTQTGFTLAGLEYGQECWCGDSFLVANTAAPTGDCSMACNADDTELCGARYRMSVYTKSP